MIAEQAELEPDGRPPADLGDAVFGCILGTAVGDAMGLPYEGLSPGRARRLLGPPDRHRMVLGRGMISDDTEHTCLVARALAASTGDPEIFSRELASGLRWWLLGLPAGIGWATLRAILKLWIGFGPGRSGVFSAGNGPAMRSAVIGVCHGFDRPRLEALVAASTRMTHTDPRAFYGALAVALAAHTAACHGQHGPSRFLARFEPVLVSQPGGPEFFQHISAAAASVERGESAVQFARRLGLEKGVSGFVVHTVPVALHGWMAHPDDYAAALRAVLDCGGDADTTGAIVGAVAGAGVGPSGIPDDWIGGLWEWPRSVAWMNRLARSLADGVHSPPAARVPGLPAAGLLARNLFFILIVLGHGVRRLLPPYGLCQPVVDDDSCPD